MKTFLFIMTAYVALMRGVCDADPSASASEPSHSENSNAAASNRPKEAKQTALTDGGKQMKGKPLDEKTDDRLKSAKNDVQAQAGKAKSNTPPTSNLQKRLEETAANHNPSGNTINPHPPARPASVANIAPSGVSENHRLLARSMGVVSIGGSSFNGSRSHSPGLATVGGPANVKYGTTAAINGTGVYHKP
jgi:hypothetical protein